MKKAGKSKITITKIKIVRKGGKYRVYVVGLRYKGRGKKMLRYKPRYYREV